MIELTQLNGAPFLLNCNLIETIENIPETKISLTTGKYFLVQEERKEIIRKIISYQRMIYKNMICIEGLRPQD
ncbi:flagellar FlbD family protein [Caproicibacter fermentans]|uniref:Flagellar FlbD family protein n=1 Tax=Caproicibacter fermentans TaxID=2576756 RepID=A0A7G8TFI2_9FIRM|nr:flagellar FlbD family protein [Caproicibacter fermentans]QNK42373.1 flagellar FlbD family protein [Caproicibacter fermentans]